jgi:serine protease
MKMMFKPWFFVVLICMFLGSASSQEEHTGYQLQGKMILKVKPQFRDICFHGYIKHSHLNVILQELGNGSVARMFPDHQPLTREYDEYGHPMTDLSLIYLADFSEDMSLSTAARLLLSTGLFTYAEPYVLPELLYVPDDPLVSNQYYLHNIRAYDAWDIWKGDSSFVVGIIDTGYDFSHPDLVNAVKYNHNDPIDGIDNDNDGFIDNHMGWNLGMNNNNPQYGPVAHGVHVSGIAGATADNSFGIAGVGFHTKLLPVRIDNAAGTLVMSYQGIVYAADHGANVINCSWGSTFGAGQFGQDIVNYAVFNRNALVVAAAGNSNNEQMFYPCSYDHVLCVAATKADDSKWENSSYYRRVDISAPGHNIYSTWVNGSFIYSGGTSMASPAVAGAAALIWSYFPGFHPLQVTQLLKNSADFIDTLPQNVTYTKKLGYGRLNMYRALTDTMKPAIKLMDVEVTDQNDDVFVMNDTLYITAHFFNYLAPSQNLEITMRCNSPHIQMIDSIFAAGTTATMTGFSNTSTPFRFKLSAGIPSSHQLLLEFLYSDGDYSGYDFYTLTVNIDYLDLNVNFISATITSKSNIGYNDNLNFQQGVGLRYQQSGSLISCAGLMVGRANNQVSDNLYGFISPFESDFVAVASAAYINPPVKGDQEIVSVFNDDGAGAQKLNVAVKQHSFAWEETERENFMVLEYFIVNSGTSELTNLYAGFYADWELKIRNQNKAATNQLLRFGYVHSLDSSLYAAVQLLTPGNFSHYAVDNDGQDGSVNLTDGFSSTEKFMTLSNPRSTAGNHQFGNNVSSVVSSGPLTLQPGDTMHIAYALHVAETYSALLQSAEQAQQSWYEMQTAGVKELSEYPDLTVFPNPFRDELTICTDYTGQFQIIEVTDIAGRIMITEKFDGDPCMTIITGRISPGIYVIRMTGENGATRKLIKL